MRLAPVSLRCKIRCSHWHSRLSRLGVFAAVSLSLGWVATGCASHKRVPVPEETAPQATAPVLPADHPSFAAPSDGSDVTATDKPIDPVQQDQVWIDASKAAYDSGVRHYQAREFPAARADFDRSVDIFLSSGRDLSNDALLNHAFEKTVDQVNALEMEALQQGNGFNRQEATPVDIANDVTFPVDPNIKAQAQAELKNTSSDLPLVVNDYVASFINYFSNTNGGHNTIKHALARAGRYQAMIQKVLEEEGVPKDLIYLAVAESGFQPRAVNRRSGAGGMWQFMPWAGSFGLERNRWVDERFDPIHATHAYARYIKSLHAQFGDWYLAMAAYDWGAGAVQRSVQRTGYADFWELYRRNALPAETKNYVPIILAATIMAKNPAQYGLSDLTPDPPLLMDTVTVHTSIDLRLAADLVGSTTEELVSMNPSLLHMRTPAGEAFDLHLPAGTGPLFEKRIQLIPADHRDAWRYVTVAQGDSLNSLSLRFHIPAVKIASANSLAPHTELTPGSALVIPALAVPIPTAARTRYHVRRGDTVVTVADRFGVMASDVRRWNHVQGNSLPPGRMLFVSAPANVSHRRRSSSRPHAGPPSAHTHRAAKGAHRRSGRSSHAKAHAKKRAHSSK